MTEIRTQVIQQLNQTLIEKFEVKAEKLVPEARLKEDLNLDSLDFVDMFVTMETQFQGNINNADLLKIRTLGDVYDLVTELASAAPPPKENTISQ